MEFWKAAMEGGRKKKRTKMAEVDGEVDKNCVRCCRNEEKRVSRMAVTLFSRAHVLDW